MYSPHSTETWVVHVVESCWSSANLWLLTFQRRENYLGIRDRRWLTEGNPLGKSGLADEHLVRTDEGVVFARSVRRLAGQKKTSEQLSKHHRGRRRRLLTSRLRLNLSLPPHAPQEAPEDEKEEPAAEHEEAEEVQGEPVDTDGTPRASSAGRGEKRTETQVNVSVKKRAMMKSPKRPATLVSLLDDPV